MSVYLMFLVMSVYRDGRPDFGTLVPKSGHKRHKQRL